MGVPTHEEIPAPVTKEDLERVRLHGVAMPLEIMPIAEARSRNLNARTAPCAKFAGVAPRRAQCLLLRFL